MSRTFFRPYNYNVKFDFPASNVGESISDIVYGLTGDYLANATTFPGLSMNTRSIKVMGREYFVPRNFKNSGTWACTFYIDELHSLSTRFEKWMINMDNWIKSTSREGAGLLERISDATGSYSAPLFGNITVQAGIFAGSLLVQKEYMLYNAFPYNISPVRLGDNMVGQVGEFTVDFMYNDIAISGGGFQLPSIDIPLVGKLI